MQDLSNLRAEVENWNTLHSRVAEALELLELAEADEDQSVASELEAELSEIERRLSSSNSS